MKIRYPLSALIAVSLHASACLLHGAEPGDENPEGGTVVRIQDVWKMVYVADQRNYDQMIGMLEGIIKADEKSTDALTAGFLIGRIEVDRAEADAGGSYDKARKAFESLSAKNGKTWQGQFARLALLSILQNEGRHDLVISEGRKAIEEIDWDLLGKNQPPDLVELGKLNKQEERLTPDVVRVLVATSHIQLGQKKEAEEWISKIESEALKSELRQALGQ
ncbi:hypothetical protein JIN84_06230 [Luteolibacter yonseiensis]|uniref:Tetratricopeptide repeat protein n=1 Tax=Luteolibacter yonseiensis TaxID=1144680 RepID=A0A934R1H0_9BACT|nr:hypothetical protein [Luteolibacter yonseiensis]MBK1815201.1 hypothetical protein [Luteolibacter yonseiensis]